MPMFFLAKSVQIYLSNSRQTVKLNKKQNCSLFLIPITVHLVLIRVSGSKYETNFIFLQTKQNLY